MTPTLNTNPARDPLIPEDVRALWDLVDDIWRTAIALRAAEVDEQCRWPAHSMAALAEAGLLGLHVPRNLGGHEQGLLALTVLCQAIGRACALSALCFGMHNVGSAVLAAKATPFHEEAFLRPIAQGRHITTLALSEPGTGSHFYLPETELKEDGASTS